MVVKHQLPFTATIEDYERDARALFDGLQARENPALWNFKWLHPHYRGKTVTDVRPESLDIDDARLVVAQEYSFYTCRHRKQETPAHSPSCRRSSRPR